ncbi:hypothetical protein [Glycomyces terrestris]|uniref:Uncharacterized protein n=1 Tax=Glycomyces terrestris TaxID=2493553 RepID=A0A426V0Q9_9ACTN|nr:hypothetical protein [Glycomyces terrestris]RRS00423.1 hypothetical protein EIW28_07600 [Glycomyces terrestris]
MRVRLIGAAAVLAGAALVSVPAATAAGAEEPEAIVEPAAEVALPTGESVGIAADGTLDLPAGEAFSVGRNASGERIVVPVDAIDEVASGELEAADFNVDAPGDGFESETETDAEPNVTVTGEWLDGSTPAAFEVSWRRVGTDLGGGPEYTADGTAELSLEPGRYHLVTMMYQDAEDAESDVVSAVQEIRVGENPVEILVDGSKAKPLGFDLDREAQTESVMIDVFSYGPDHEEGGGAWLGLWAQPGGDMYAVPTGRLSSADDVGYVLREGLSSPEGTTDPYSYNLFRHGTGGFRGDLTPPVRDRNLARIDMDYQALGAEGVFNRQELSEHPDYPAGMYITTGEVALPSSRTEFFTADPEVEWEHRAYFPYDGGPGSAWDLVHHRSGVLDAGSVQDMAWNNAPLSVGIDNIGQDWPPATFVRWDELGVLYFGPWMFSSSAGGEGIHSEYLPGKISLVQDGQVIAQNSEIGLGLDPGRVEAGELTITASADRNAPWTPLGTHSEAAWTFDYDPAGNPVLPVSVVEFAASGIVNGAAEGGTVQDVVLEFAQQPGADEQECAAMTFEVSFDDGATWTPVPLDRDGNTATASLALPDDAAFASVRFTAADEDGNTVSHETIRSYAIA